MSFFKNRKERKEAEREEQEWLEQILREREVEEKQIRKWSYTLDKYLGSVRDYSSFMGQEFKEIDLEDERYQKGRAWKWVTVEGDNPEWDMLAKLMDQHECVGFVHYVPLQKVGYYHGGGGVPTYIGGYGIPIKKDKD